MYTLVGVDGNAYAIMGYTQRAMRQTGFSKDEIDQMLDEAKESDYYHLIAVCNGWIDKCNERIDEEDEDE